ncbi:MAG TPA: SAM-dependent methyltransferase [Pyrinomonadaceae bacterium]|nr:SAM-dependent methyltransferase [Pyrinomonadaceae bacterium]
MPVSLAERLKELIRREGSITFHDWMKAALYDPDGGYYQQTGRKRWGREGDYRTSPERSELFAATFARYFVTLAEGELTIVEAGAGDGSFAAGVLRTLRDQFPARFAETRYVFYELSDDARRRAQERLSEFGERVQFCSVWDQVAVWAGVYFSNELLDAFPVHRVVKSDVGLSEIYVGLDPNGDFVWTPGPLSTPRIAEFINAYSIDLAPGQIIEINLAIDDWLSAVSEKLEQGFVITVDYGAEATELYDPALRPDGTLRGFSRHGFVDDLLAQPGEYDLTTSVNWTQVKSAGEKLGWKTIEFAAQDKFLLNAGLLDQLQYRLDKAESEAEKVAATTGAREMILPGGMASSFQVLVQRRGRL